MEEEEDRERVVLGEEEEDAEPDLKFGVGEVEREGGKGVGVEAPLVAVTKSITVEVPLAEIENVGEEVRVAPSAPPLALGRGVMVTKGLLGVGVRLPVVVNVTSTTLGLGVALPEGDALRERGGDGEEDSVPDTVCVSDRE